MMCLFIHQNDITLDKNRQVHYSQVRVGKVNWKIKVYAGGINGKFSRSNVRLEVEARAVHTF